MKKQLSFGLLALLTTTSWAGSMGISNGSGCCDWTGFYGGINAGAIWSKFNGPLSVASFVGEGTTYPASVHRFSTDSSSFLGGIQVGYNWQNNSGGVFGTEFSIDGFNLSKSRTLRASEIPVGSLFVANDKFSSKSNVQAAWIGRIGIVMQNWLLYGLGGAAITNSKVNVTLVEAARDGILFPALYGSNHKVIAGGVVGAGTEYAVSPHFTVGLEYRYIGYGNHPYRVGNVAAYATEPPTTFIYSPTVANMSLNTNQVALKLNYQFN